MMTNGTVTGTVDATSGRELSLSFKGGSNKIVVPPERADRDLRAGREGRPEARCPVMFGATKNAEGKLAASRVTVGKDGVCPADVSGAAPGVEPGSPGRGQARPGAAHWSG